MEKREIKFRVWDSTPEEDSFKGVMINHNYAMESNYMAESINGNYPIMQYTGLKDKKGVEIYEGDIVKPLSAYIGCNCTVEWYDYHGWALRVGKNQINWVAQHVWESLIVIGNIYENPELL